MLILWSGGADSTYLVWKILNSDVPNGGHPIRLLSISFDGQIANSAPQREAQSKIKKFFWDKGFINLKYIDIKYDATGNIQPGGNIQAPFWIAQSAIHLQRYEDLLAGYVAGDCTLADQVDIQHMFNAMQRLRINYGQLKFPLQYVEKIQVYRELKKVGLLDLVYFCGEPNQCLRDSRVCKSCIKHRTTLWQMQEFEHCPRINGFEPELPTEADYVRQSKDWVYD